jgi:7-cyano-7-deazaguanine synthase in queuosine biosynthesis
MDSAVALAEAINKGFEIAALHLIMTKNTKTRIKSIYDFMQLLLYFGKIIVDIEYLQQIGNSSLMIEL